MIENEQQIHIESNDLDENTSDAEFYDRYVLKHEKIELNPEEEAYLEPARSEFKAEDEGTIEYEIGDLLFHFVYSKFNFVSVEDIERGDIPTKDKLISMELSRAGMSEDTPWHLFILQAATVINQESGKQQNILEDAKYLAIIFSDIDIRGSSSFSPLPKVLVIREKLNSFLGTLSLMHEIGHEITTRGTARKIEKIKAARARSRSKVSKGRYARLLINSESDASNHAYSRLKSISDDENLLGIAKRLYEVCISNHVERLK